MPIESKYATPSRCRSLNSDLDEPRFTSLLDEGINSPSVIWIWFELAISIVSVSFEVLDIFSSFPKIISFPWTLKSPLTEATEEFIEIVPSVRFVIDSAFSSTIPPLPKIVTPSEATKSSALTVTAPVTLPSSIFKISSRKIADSDPGFIFIAPDDVFKFTTPSPSWILSAATSPAVTFKSDEPSNAGNFPPPSNWTIWPESDPTSTDKKTKPLSPPPRRPFPALIPTTSASPINGKAQDPFPSPSDVQICPLSPSLSIRYSPCSTFDDDRLPLDKLSRISLYGCTSAPIVRPNADRAESPPIDIQVVSLEIIILFETFNLLRLAITVKSLFLGWKLFKVSTFARARSEAFKSVVSV